MSIQLVEALSTPSHDVIAEDVDALEAPSAAPNNDDDDASLALALALQEEEDSLHYLPPSHGGSAHKSVVLVPRFTGSYTGATLRTPQRTLLTGDDADIAALPDVLRQSEQREAAGVAREAAEAALLRSLKGGGRRDGYVASAADATHQAQGIRTKHDRDLTGHHNARAVERMLGAAAAGDLSGASLSQSAMSALQRHVAKRSAKGTATSGRVEAAHNAVAGGFLDRRTRLVLFKLLASGRLGNIGGVIAAGKEAVVLRGFHWDAGTHASLAQNDGKWASRRAQVWGPRRGDHSDHASGRGGDTTAAGAADAGEAWCDDDDDDNAAAGSDVEGGDGEEYGDDDDEIDDEGGVEPDDGAGEEIEISDVAVKVFKMTLSEFRERRTYVEGDRRCARLSQAVIGGSNPRALVTAWAEREFRNLVRVHRAGIPSPAPLLLRGHIIVMSLVPSAPATADEDADVLPARQLRLADTAATRSEAPTEHVNWQSAYVQVVTIMTAMLHWCHLVHADLSEYNLCVVISLVMFRFVSCNTCCCTYAYKTVCRG